MVVVDPGRADEILISSVYDVVVTVETDVYHDTE